MQLNTTAYIRDLESALGATTTVEKKERDEAGEFHFIPLTVDDFVEQLTVAVGLLRACPMEEQEYRRNPVPIKFVDVGCGIGTKLLLANRLFYDLELYGIEKFPRYVKIAKALFQDAHMMPAEVIQADALTQSYKDYDIIYFYCPMFDMDKQLALEKQIIKTAKKGALFMVNLPKGKWGTGQTAPVWNQRIYRKV